jgi:nicotinate-nucleotide pyrophosphorylase (carboxylating)
MPPNLQPPPIDPHTMALIRMAVREDLGHASYGTVQGDKTAQLAIPAELTSTGTIVARRAGVIAGTYLIETILREYQVGMTTEILAPDGTAVAAEQPVARITGGTRTILSAERVLLNFLGHLSGVATMTRRYVDAVAGTRAVISDTRKTTPAYRVLDKYAVRCGGGLNLRIGLYDGVMLKDNHLAALRAQLGASLSIADLTRNIRSQLDSNIPLWLEVDTLDQLREELSGPGGANIVLLDNMGPENCREAVLMRNAAAANYHPSAPPLLEASGGITLANIRGIAETGVDRISIGALTHSAPVLDLSMEF